MAGLRVWASKLGRRFRGGTDDTWWPSGSSRQGEATDEETRWPSDEDEPDWTITPLS
jgi:hypothetical protein